MPPVAASWPFLVMTDRVRDRSTDELNMEWSVTAMLATGGVFQRPEPVSAPGTRERAAWIRRASPVMPLRPVCRVPLLLKQIVNRGHLRRTAIHQERTGEATPARPAPLPG